MQTGTDDGALDSLLAIRRVQTFLATYRISFAPLCVAIRCPAQLSVSMAMPDGINSPFRLLATRQRTPLNSPFTTRAIYVSDLDGV